MYKSVNEFLWPVRVYYEDTDAGGVVYHSIYLNFMERARTEWLRELGFEQDELRSDYDVLFAVRHMQIDYLLPARFNDALQVTVQLTELKKASLKVKQEIKRNSDNKILCTALVRIASLSASALKAAAIPSAVHTRLLQLT